MHLEFIGIYKVLLIHLLQITAGRKVSFVLMLIALVDFSVRLRPVIVLIFDNIRREIHFNFLSKKRGYDQWRRR